MTRKPSDNPLRNYRSVDTSGGVWWKRNRDPTGLHTVVAFSLALALVAVVGVTLDPLGVTTRFDLPEEERKAFDEAYVSARETGLARATEQGRQQALVELALVETARGSPWVEGVRTGWSDGWNQALSALTEASEASAPDEELERELELLEGIPRR